MKNTEAAMDNEIKGDYALSYDLKGRQSVRATFRLSTGSITAISIVAGQLGIKQKSIFDYLVEDVESLQSIARQLNRDLMNQKSERVQKTFVISRRSLSSLELVASRFNAPRDALVELSVQRLLPIIARERKKHADRKAMLEKIVSFHRTGKLLADKLQTHLGAEDPMADHFNLAMSAVTNAFSQIMELIERGQVLEMLDEQSDDRNPDQNE
jgi:hypothetical protein